MRTTMKRLTINPNLLKTANTPFVYRLTVLVNHLSLPCREILLGSKTTPNPTLDAEFVNNGDQFLQDAIDQCVKDLPTLKESLVKSRQTCKIYKYVEEQYGLVLDKILSQIENIAVSSPLALLEIFTLWQYASTFQQLIPHLIPWFIRYGEESDITDHEILQKLQHVYYRDYVARLPPESLHTYLVSDNPQERVMAVNKYKLEMGLE